MEILCRPLSTTASHSHRYAVLVAKPPGLMCEYIVRISRDHSGVLADWYPAWRLHQAWCVDMFDLQALWDINQRWRFDLFTPMHYNAAELETLFVKGIGAVIKRFMQQHPGALLFWAATRPALGRWFNYLLKKHTTALDCLYRSDIQMEVGLYVIERRRSPAAPGRAPVLAGSTLDPASSPVA